MLKGIFVLLFSIDAIYAQNEGFIIKNFNTDNGLPSNNISHCTFDKNGFLWIATQSGLTRFDGTKFKTFNIFNTPFIKNNRFMEFQYESDSTLLVMSSQPQLFRINEKSELKYLDGLSRWKNILTENEKKATQNKKDKPLYFFKISNQLYFVSNSQKIYSLKNEKIQFICDLSKLITYKFDFKGITLSSFYDNISLSIKDSVYLMEFNGNKVLLKNLGLSLKGVNGLVCFFHDKVNNTFYLHSTNKGLFIVNKNKFENLRIKNSNESVLRVSLINNNILTVQYNEMLNKKYPEIVENKSLFFNISPDTICYFHNDGIVLYSNGKYNYKKIEKASNVKKNDLIYDAYPTKKGYTVLSKTQILYLTKDNRLKLVFNSPDLLMEYACQSNKTNNWLIAFYNGDVKYYNSEKKTIKIIPYLSNKSVRFIKYDTSLNCFWIFTYGMGVYLMDNNLNITALGVDKNEYLNYGHYYLIDSMKYYWIPTNNGLFRFKQSEIIKKIGGNYKGLNFSYYSKEQGIMNNEFNGRFLNSGVVLPNGNFAMSNVDGIITFNPYSFKEDLSYSPLLIDDIIIFNDTSLGSINQLSIKEGFVNLKLVLAQANIGDEYSEGIEYKISEDFSNWLKLESNILELSSLKKGVYNFCFRNTGESNVNNYVYFKLTVLPLWYNSNWAYAVYFISLGLLLYLIILSFFRIKQKKQKNELILMESELKALRAQINPHYISNSLMSLQSLILKNDKFQAMEAMSMYGKVMRGILNDSEKPFVSLQTEISTLKDYINLEAMLFYEKADFTIKYESIDSVLLHLIEVPSMLIQPYVENAINHGLMPKKTGPFQLVIHFEFNEKLICVIQDNGIGRTLQSNNLKRASKGNLNIENRIKLYGKIFKQSLSIEIIDLKNENNEPCGTKVIIQLPYYLN